MKIEMLSLWKTFLFFTITFLKYSTITFKITKIQIIKNNLFFSVACILNVDGCEHDPNDDIAPPSQQLRPDATARRLPLSSTWNNLQRNFRSNVEPVQQLLRLLRLALLSDRWSPSQPKLRLPGRTFTGDGHVSCGHGKRFISSQFSPLSISIFWSEISHVSSQQNKIPVDKSP